MMMFVIKHHNSNNMASQVVKSRSVSDSSAKKNSSQPSVNKKSEFHFKSDRNLSCSVKEAQNPMNIKKRSYDNATRSGTGTIFKTRNEKLNYAVLLPYLMDENFQSIKQPFLFQFDTGVLEKSGFSLPFSSFFEPQRNNFILRFCDEQFNAQIIAIGESIQEVKASLKTNIQLNPLWSNLNKVIGKLHEIPNLIHSPLDSEEAPTQSIIGKKKIKCLTTVSETCVDAVRKNSETRTKRRGDDHLDRKNESPDSNSIQISACDNQKQSAFDSVSEKDDFREFYELNDGPHFSEVTQESLNKKIQALTQRTAVLSDSDILASTLKGTIDTLCSLFSYINKEKVLSATIYKVPGVDETYKVKKKDKIFLEGLIELSLSKYQTAIERAKPRNPCAFAYQLVSIAFPSTYYSNVWLGKKYYDEKEISIFFEQIKHKDAKFPLLFIWSFKDPFNEPIIGEFDIFLGQKRVRAFTDHIFRKSGTFEYDEELESKVRTRLSKVLCSKNRKNISGDSTNVFDSENNQDCEEESSNGAKLVKKQKFGNSEELEDIDIWDTACFD